MLANTTKKKEIHCTVCVFIDLLMDRHYKVIFGGIVGTKIYLIFYNRHTNKVDMIT